MKTLNLNYKKFTGVFQKKGKDGKMYIAFPAEDNGIVIHEKGFFHNMTLTESHQEYSDHFLKTNFSKDKYSAMSDEQKRNIPIIGNAKIIEGDLSPATSGSNDEDLPI